MQRRMFSKTHEKTLIDKLLAREEAARLKELIQKKGLKREELLEIIHIAGNIHSKLLNYSEYDRYVNTKYYVWLREFIVICELFYDITAELEIQEKDGNINKEKLQEIKRIIDKTSNTLEHTAKAMIDLYLNIGTTSLSIRGTFLLESLRNKFEVDYRNPMFSQTPEKQGLLGGFGLKKQQ